MSHLLVSSVILLNDVLSFYLTLIIARVILGWLVNFGVLNGANGVVAFIHDAIAALIDPVTSKLTGWMPWLIFKSVDLSPVVLYFVVQAIQVALLSVIL